MFENLYLVFIIGFFSGIGFLSLLFFLRKEKKIEVKEDTNLISLKNMENGLYYYHGFLLLEIQ